MTYSIAFCGIDGAGKTTIINRIYNKLNAAGWKWTYSHQNGFMKKFYNPKKGATRRWEKLNQIELKARCRKWKKINRTQCLLLDRCYICSLVYSNIQGYPDIAHRIKQHAFKPDIIVLLEPVEEIVGKATFFNKEYKKNLQEEEYEQFGSCLYIFGVISFWKQPETALTPLITAVLELLGLP